MRQRPPSFLASVPLQQRLLHVGLHAALLVVEVAIVLALTLGLVAADLVSAEVGGKLAVGYLSWVATITTAFSVVASRFPKAPLFIVAFHALALPGSVLLLVLLNLQLILRLLQAS